MRYVDTTGRPMFTSDYGYYIPPPPRDVLQSYLDHNDEPLKVYLYSYLGAVDEPRSGYSVFIDADVVHNYMEVPEDKVLILAKVVRDLVDHLEGRIEDLPYRDLIEAVGRVIDECRPTYSLYIDLTNKPTT